eukprot:3376462-Amphidinium_carterae.1
MAVRGRMEYCPMTGTRIVPRAVCHQPIKRLDASGRTEPSLPFTRRCVVCEWKTCGLVGALVQYSSLHQAVCEMSGSISLPFQIRVRATTRSHSPPAVEGHC